MSFSHQGSEAKKISMEVDDVLMQGLQANFQEWCFLVRMRVQWTYLGTRFTADLTSEITDNTGLAMYPAFLVSVNAWVSAMLGSSFYDLFVLILRMFYFNDFNLCPNVYHNR